MPSRTAAIDPSEFRNEGVRALLSRVFGRNPLDTIGIVVLLVAAGAILANALYRQPGPHPAPIFSVKPRPVATTPAEVVPPMPRARPAGIAPAKQEGTRSRIDVTADIQRELTKRGLYEGPADGVMGPKTDAAIRDFETLANLKVTGEPTEEVLRAMQRVPSKAVPVPTARPASDPIAELISGAPPGQRVIAVQRALNDYGYGPVKATGSIGPETTAAIQKFERDRKMPVTGQISPRLMRELAALTGRPLE